MSPKTGKVCHPPPAAFLESQYAHAPGESALPLSGRVAAPGQTGPFLGGKMLNWGMFEPENGQSVRGSSVAFLESQNAHAPGVSALPLSGREPEPGQTGPFLGARCHLLFFGGHPPSNQATCLPKRSHCAGPPRRVPRAAAHSRRARERFAAEKRASRVQNASPVFAGSPPPKSDSVTPKPGKTRGPPPDAFRGSPSATSSA